MTRILITGAAGFLGAALGARLRADGDEVVGIDRVADPAHGVTAGDTTTPAPSARNLAGYDAGVPRMVLLSSVRAFSDTGFPDGVTEEHPVRPDGNPYVDTKIASEHVVLSAHAAGEIESVIVRPGDVYGPGSVPWVLKPLEAIRGGQFLLPAMGRGVHSPVYVDDVVDGIVRAQRAPVASGRSSRSRGRAG